MDWGEEGGFNTLRLRKAAVLNILQSAISAHQCSLGSAILYIGREKVVEKHGFDHPDAVALGRAFSQALERPKHGGTIPVSKHVHSAW